MLYKESCRFILVCRAIQINATVFALFFTNMFLFISHLHIGCSLSTKSDLRGEKATHAWKHSTESGNHRVLQIKKQRAKVPFRKQRKVIPDERQTRSHVQWLSQVSWQPGNKRVAVWRERQGHYSWIKCKFLKLLSSKSNLLFRADRFF